MLDRKVFIRAFSTLGEHLKSVSDCFLLDAMKKTEAQNPFFTIYMQQKALKVIAGNYLTEEALSKLLRFSEGPLDDRDFFNRRMERKRVGIIMAGNIPAVGFHDLLCVLSTGAKARVKVSSKDGGITRAIVQMLEKISPEISSAITFEDRRFLFEYQGRLDYLLFSGSDANRSLLKDEFPGLPMLSRGSRFSLGVLSGKETDQELELLAEDMFLYCGLGCRSISYLFVPKGYDMGRIIRASTSMAGHLTPIEPYMSNVVRQRALDTLEGVPFLDGGFFLLEPSDSPFPQIGCVRYSEYGDISEIDSFCSRYRDQIQKKYTNFGIAQSPATDDWMDGINTVTSILEGCLADAV